MSKVFEASAFMTDEHRMIQQAARDFAQKEVAPVAAEFDESGEFPLETVKKMGAMGFMGIEEDMKILCLQTQQAYFLIPHELQFVLTSYEHPSDKQNPIP